MKKLALVLGSLLVVGTAASAKEVVPAPAVVPEKVVEVVEKPVIVYRDREVEQKWRPNGSVDVQYRWYGETEKKNIREDVDGDWANTANNYGRLQTLVGVNFTENQKIEIRTRNFHTLKSENDSTRKADELRLRHFYNFGTLGDSKVTAKSRLHYNQKESGKKEASVSVAFDFSNYFFSNDYFKVTGFALRPEYKHSWAAHGNDNSQNRYALNLETSYDLPFGFSAELNLYGRYDRKLKDNRFVGEDDYKSDLNLGVEAYLYNTTNLYKNGNFGVDFTFEGGYDEYTIHQKKLVENSDGYERREYSLYALPALKATYKPTEFVSLYAAAGAEYRNWRISAESEAKNWRWQPTAWAGMKVTF